MIFAHTLDKVLSGEKSQTRRIRKPGDEFFPEDLGDAAAVMHKGFSAYRLMWEVGKTYAVQPGRGKPAVARIQIVNIRREDVREISDADVKAEGFETASDFFMTWCKMHDKGQTLPIIPDYYTGAIVWQGVRSELQQRPAERYQAWVLIFRLVEAAPDAG